MARTIQERLRVASDASFALYAIVAAFSTYFCMYAFRKPFAAASYDGMTFFETDVSLKTAFVISQLIGYTASKFLGIRVCSEADRKHRWRLLLGLILAAEISLLLFAVLPLPGKIVAIFLNGLPLGMVWGICVSYLEGRRSSDLLLAGLSCSFIVASGVVKDVGRWLMAGWAVPEFWMPFATGALFFPGLLLASWMLDQIPPPSDEDIEARTERTTMNREDRWTFVRQFLPGLVMLLVGYLLLTAFRDFRDNYGIEIFRELGYGGEPAIFMRSELPVAFGVIVVMGLLNVIRSNKWGLVGAFAVMSGGLLLLLGSTFLFQTGAIDGLTWMILTGLGSYLAYVPFNTVLFERMIAYTRVTSTAVFTIYLADAIGYSGSVGIQLYKDLVQTTSTRLDFFVQFCWVMGGLGTILMVLAGVYFVRWPDRRRQALPD